MGDAGKPLVDIALAKLQSDNPYAQYAAIGLVGTLAPRRGDEARSGTWQVGE